MTSQTGQSGQSSQSRQGQSGQAYQFQLNEGQSTATLTIQADSEQSAVQQAQQLLRNTDQLGSPQQVSSQSAQIG
jgi:hypothetical protein